MSIEMLSYIDSVVFDLDGTIYYGSKLIDGANDVIEFFRSNGKRIFFLTNNSTKTRRQIYRKLADMGVSCVENEVLTSGYIAAEYAKHKNFSNVYIFGSEDLKEEFALHGVNICNNETAENLLIGYDPSMTYEGLAKAVRVAMGAKWVMACNKERTFPSADAVLMPGCGAMTAAVEWCANRKSDIVIGKPSTFILDHLSDIHNVDKKRVLVIGDTYESDILMAQNAGAQSVLISTESTAGDVVTVKQIKEIIDLFDKRKNVQ